MSGTPNSFEYGLKGTYAETEDATFENRCNRYRGNGLKGTYAETEDATPSNSPPDTLVYHVSKALTLKQRMQLVKRNVTINTNASLKGTYAETEDATC